MMKYVEKKLYRPTHLALLPMTTWNSLGKKETILRRYKNILLTPAITSVPNDAIIGVLKHETILQLSLKMAKGLKISNLLIIIQM